MARLTLRLLGPFQAILDGKPVTTFESDKARALLAYLAIEHARPQPREKLVGLFWPDLPETSARNNLSHALTNLRHALGDRDTEPHVLLASRQTIQFKHESEAWVDALAFSDLLGRRDLASLEQSADLYQGRFLEGFSLPDCVAFEEWQLLEQEHLHRLAMRALGQLAAVNESEADLERALHFARRQLALEPWWESAHQQVMRLLARSGQRDGALAQYQACARLMAEELGGEPSAETRRLHEQIRAGEPAAEPIRREALRPAVLPAFLSGDGKPPAAPPVFVARRAELARLDGYLQAALTGQGQAAFVIGGAGRGKTALLHEFARRALDAQPDLLVAMGTCDAYAGMGDSFLPFRQALAMLSGNLEASCAAGVLTTAQARRQWQALPRVAAVLGERGSALVQTLLSGPELMARVRAGVPAGDESRARLERLANPERAPAAGLEQSHLLQQVANVLLDLSQAHPLVIAIDDLQWADPSSLALLFHLGRRLAPGRILLLGAYRPDELALGRDGERHALEPVLSEFRRRLGDIWLDLRAADEAEGHRLVEELIDSEPNALGAVFRSRLFERTHGHPLFVVETLRGMQERHELVRDEAGRWTVGASLDWDTLPVRAEAAIAERIERLPQALRDILSTASVEGEEFTAEAVALAQGADRLQVLRLLRVELSGRHRLVRERGEVHAGGQHLARYRFAHHLFQQHVYRSLGEGERRLLHQRVGGALEALYAGHLDQVAVQLARHFAGDPERECRYLARAGEVAAERYANAEAAAFFSRALALVPDADVAGRYGLLLARVKVHDLLGQAAALGRDVAELAELADELGAEQQAEAALWRSGSRLKAADFPAAIAAAQDAVERGRAAGRTDCQAQGNLDWAAALHRLGDYAAAQEQAEQALALAREGSLLSLQAAALFRLSKLVAERGDWALGHRYDQEALALFREAGDRPGELVQTIEMGGDARYRHEFALAFSWLGRARDLAREIGDRAQESAAEYNLGNAHLALGEYRVARECLEGALLVFEEAGFRARAIWALSRLCDVSRRLGDRAASRSYAEKAEGIRRELASQDPMTNALIPLGRLYQDSGDLDAARRCFEQAELFRRESGAPVYALQPQAALASVALAQGDVARAMAHASGAVAYLETGGAIFLFEDAFWLALTCFQVLRAGGDPRADRILGDAYALLVDKASRIPDEAQRRSYLENVAEHREIVAEYTRLKPPQVP